MSTLIKKIFVKTLEKYALRFTSKKKISEEITKNISEKLKKASNSTLGKELGISYNSNIDKLPLTNYGFYQKYFEFPNSNSLLYPINDYVKVSTSGTMGKPKSFLVPKPALTDNMQKTGFSNLFLYTHDGEKVTFEYGDVVYTNTPGGNHLAAYNSEIGAKQNKGLVKLCPDINLLFKDKVEFFIENYNKIDVAYMPVTTLIDDVYPKIGHPFKLKGFITQDSSACFLKEEIKKIIGSYPKVTYGSTETLASTMPSIENPGSFFFDWRVLFIELIPEKDQIKTDFQTLKEPKETLSFLDAEVNKKYQVVATLYKTDLTRYVMPDIIECTCIGDDVLGLETPVFKYYSRSDKIINLHNFTRIGEPEMLEVLLASGIKFVDFVVSREVEGSREYMILYIETDSKIDETDLYRAIDEELTTFDKDWRDLKNYFNYYPLKIRFLPKGSFNRYLSNKKGMPSIDRIGMKEENLKQLLKQD
ncbi:GH3 auxin-responsive promoter family protein [Candidatus Bathyarchaeota archaeon]|nr:GH3 auxin-responsive promoter family protein [Candidatus Bathyarchaeota archaeon]